jgi:hypothetical protein
VTNVRVACDPANVGHAAESVIWMYVEDVLHSEGRAEKIATSGVDDTLGLASGTRRLRKSFSKRYKPAKTA